MDSFEKIEEYLASVEEYFFSSLSAVAHGLPDVHEVANRLWIDISRYGPGLPAFPEVRIPSLGDFQVPPPPPPPPSLPATHWLANSTDWMARHPWKTAGIAATAVGAGLLVGYSVTDRKRRGLQRLRSQQTKPTERRQVVVVLGADSPFGLPLILGLEKKGYIVIASVADPEAVEPLEQQTQGYVKALVLDPYEPLLVPAFLRSLAATMSRKFPINAPGDPHAPLSSHPYIHSIISLLTLPKTSTSTLAPLEHISLPETYLPYLTATHITPLQVIQALLPLLRSGPAAISHDKGKKTIVVCLPATDTRIGLPFTSMRSMSAASTLRGVEVLRREISAAAATGRSDAMKNVKVVVIDVGTFDIGGSGTGEAPTESVCKAMEGWTASEKVTYGPAFASVLHGAVAASSAPKSAWETVLATFKSTYQYGVPRRPTDVSVFVDNVIGAVSSWGNGYTICGVGLGFAGVRNWVKGERIVVGAGAHTYKFASYMPSALLEGLLNIPHFLIGVRNRLLMVNPFLKPSSNLPSAQNIIRPKTENTSTSQARSQAEHQADASEHGGQGDATSEYDVESVSGESGVDSSWVSLNGSRTDIRGDM